MWSLLTKIKKTFKACLLRLNEDDPPREYTEFDFDEVAEGDRHLLRLGGIFSWAIGIEERNGIRQRYSRVVFRRLPVWTKESLEASQKEMIDLVSRIKWANDVSPIERSEIEAISDRIVENAFKSVLGKKAR